MKILPFTEEITEDADVKHIFRVKNNSEEHPKIYETTITLIPIDTDKYQFLCATCQCKGFTCNKTDNCKHIRYCKEILNEIVQFDDKPKN
jgi:hypothetical protein